MTNNSVKELTGGWKLYDHGKNFNLINENAWTKDLETPLKVMQDAGVPVTLDDLLERQKLVSAGYKVSKNFDHFSVYSPCGENGLVFDVEFEPSDEYIA